MKKEYEPILTAVVQLILIGGRPCHVLLEVRRGAVLQAVILARLQTALLVMVVTGEQIRAVDERWLIGRSSSHVAALEPGQMSTTTKVAAVLHVYVRVLAQVEHPRVSILLLLLLVVAAAAGRQCPASHSARCLLRQFVRCKHTRMMYRPTTA